MFLVVKERDVLTKRGLAKVIGVDPNSIQKWRTTYLKSGLESLLVFADGGKKITH